MKKTKLLLLPIMSVLLVGCNQTKINRYNRSLEKRIKDFYQSYSSINNIGTFKIHSIETQLCKMKSEIMLEDKQGYKTDEIYYTETLLEYASEKRLTLEKQYYYGCFIDTKTIYIIKMGTIDQMVSYLY